MHHIISLIWRQDLARVTQMETIKMIATRRQFSGSEESLTVLHDLLIELEQLRSRIMVWNCSIEVFEPPFKRTNLTQISIAGMEPAF